LSAFPFAGAGMGGSWAFLQWSVGVAVPRSTGLGLSVKKTAELNGSARI